MGLDCLVDGDGRALIRGIGALTGLAVLDFTFGTPGASSFIFCYAPLGIVQSAILFVILSTQGTT
jgi:hypothetical protein